MTEGETLPISILGSIKTGFIGRNILYYRSVSSTMDIARRVAGGGAIEGTIIIAEEQVAGRGRRGRKWSAPSGSSILLSIILYPDLAQLPQLNMVASLAVVQSIERVCQLKPTIKWPNDVLINDKKVCGILIESDLEAKGVNKAVVGIGLNIDLDPFALPELSAPATSLFAELGRKVSRQEILLALLFDFEQLYQKLRRGESLRGKWASYLETIGKLIKVRSGSVIEEGYAETVEEDGSLVLRRHDGSLAILVAGEVTLR